MNGDDKRWHDEKKIEINPSWVIQGLVACLLAVVSWSITGTLERLEDDIKQGNIDRAQLRADMTALEIGLRGDRFTRNDWEKEQRVIQSQLDSIQADIDKLRKEAK